MLQGRIIKKTLEANIYKVFGIILDSVTVHISLGNRNKSLI